jgi:hypothetical protein
MANETTPIHSWRLVTRCLLLKLRPSEKLVLQALAFHYPKPFPSIDRIAALAGVSRATAKRALRELVGKGLIFKNWRRKQTTVYELKVDRILMQAEKREKSLAQNEPQGQFEPGQNEPVAQIEPGQDDPLSENIIGTEEDIELNNYASKELGNKPEELIAGIEIESDDHAARASRGDLTVDAQSALRPNCASSRPEVDGVKDHGSRADLRIPVDNIHACQQELDTTTSPPSAGLPHVSNTSTSSKDWLEGIIADDAEEDTEDNAEPVVAVPQQAMRAPASAERATSAPKPQPKPERKFTIEQGPFAWYIFDKKRNVVDYAPTYEETWLKAMKWSGTPYDRFNAFRSGGIYKVCDTAGGVITVVKTCAIPEEANEEAARLNKESK